LWGSAKPNIIPFTDDHAIAIGVGAFDISPYDIPDLNFLRMYTKGFYERKARIDS